MPFYNGKEFGLGMSMTFWKKTTHNN
jgi:hypothetical protein